MALFRSRKIRMAAKNVSHQERRVSPAESARMLERARSSVSIAAVTRRTDARTRTFPSLLLSHSGTGSQAAILILMKTDTVGD